MEKYITITCTVISAIGAIASIYYANNTRKIQENLVINKTDIERIIQTIDHLRKAQALVKTGDQFDDTDFMAIWDNNLQKVKSLVAILQQNPALRETLKDIDNKSFQFEQLDSIVVLLENCMKLLLK